MLLQKILIVICVWFCLGQENKLFAAVSNEQELVAPNQVVGDVSFDSVSLDDNGISRQIVNRHFARGAGAPAQQAFENHNRQRCREKLFLCCKGLREIACCCACPIVCIGTTICCTLACPCMGCVIENKEDTGCPGIYDCIEAANSIGCLESAACGLLMASCICCPLLVCDKVCYCDDGMPLDGYDFAIHAIEEKVATF